MRIKCFNYKHFFLQSPSPPQGKVRKKRVIAFWRKQKFLIRVLGEKFVSNYIYQHIRKNQWVHSKPTFHSNSEVIVSVLCIFSSFISTWVEHFFLKCGGFFHGHQSLFTNTFTRDTSLQLCNFLIAHSMKPWLYWERSIEQAKAGYVLKIFFAPSLFQSCGKFSQNKWSFRSRMLNGHAASTLGREESVYQCVSIAILMPGHHL